jgi:hypothetical protein
MEGMMEGLLEELNFLNDSAMTAVATFRMGECGHNVGASVYGHGNAWGLGQGFRATE